MNLTEMFKGKNTEAEAAPQKATDLLKSDHQKVKSLFRDFRGLDEDENREKDRLFEEIRRELTVHSKVEEEIFYPAVKSLPEAEAKDRVLEAGEEHAIVKTLLDQLENLEAGNDVFDAKMKVMMEAVEHHADEEESEMFREARKGFDDERLLALGARIEERKRELLADEGVSGRRSRRSAASAPRRPRRSRPAVNAGSDKKGARRSAKRRAR